MPRTKKQSADKKRRLQNERRKERDEKLNLAKKEKKKNKKMPIAQNRIETVEIEASKETLEQQDPKELKKHKIAIKRQNPEYLKLEREQKSLKRQNPEILQLERDKKALKRQKPEVLQLERDKKALKRQDKEYLDMEKQNKALKRLDPIHYKNEKEKIVEARNNLSSQNKEYYKKIKQVENIKKRSDPEYVQLENEINKNRMANKRKIDSLNNPNKRRKIGTTAFEKFKEAIREGPDTICACCKRLWFSTSCTKTDRKKLENKFGLQYCNSVFLNGTSETFCSSCYQSIRKMEIPTFCSTNFQIIFPIPNELKHLTVLEERMVALRIPFMKITSGIMKQCSIRGQIVNVPLNINTTTDILPRNVEDTHTIQIKLKRKMEYNQHYIQQTVRPNTVLKALDYLLDQPLYKEQNVKKSIDWEKNIQNYVNSQSASNAAPKDTIAKLKQLPDWVDLKSFGLDETFVKECIINHKDNQQTNIPMSDNIQKDIDLNVLKKLQEFQEFVDLKSFGLDETVVKEFLINHKDNQQTNITMSDNIQKDIDLNDLNHLKDISIIDQNTKVDETNITDSLNIMSLTNQPNPIVQQNHSLAISRKDSNEDIWADENLFVENEPVNPGGEETLLDNEEIENICFAPGENNTPIHLMLDKYAEELSFPTLFCGQKKEVPDNFSYANQAKVQAQSVDRRFARTDFLLYMSKKMQLFYVVHAIKIALRTRLNQQGDYTVGEISKPNVINELIKNDAGYMFLQKIRNSPAYWRNEQRKILAMVRQFNIPTIFLTISAAESRWYELLVILVKVVDGKSISEDEARNLSYIETVRLIRADPITTARYFDHRFRLLMKHLKSDQGPFKSHPIEHYYYRVEFQQRGSPHIHSILWNNGAPVYNAQDPDSAKICSEFADRFITCNSKLESVQDILEYNKHNHTKNCKREVKGKYICRYGIPYLPMDYTIILEPLETKDKDYLQTMKDKFRLIKDLLNKKPSMSFEEFLQTLQLNREDYLLILQYNIGKPTMFIKRMPDECFINHFNEEIFSMQKSNMDIQFILDPYACCKYIVSYINKSERGVSDLLHDALNEIKKGNFDLKQKLKKIGGVFINASEISAQEAAYNVLGLPMHETCTSHIYINTKPIKQRVRMLKGLNKLKLLNSNDTNIYESGIIEHYIQRPDELSDLCLAEFAAHYNVASITETNTRNKLKLKDDSRVLTYKKHAKIISYRRYGLQQDPINFYREQLMLYVPWRNETNEIEDVDHLILYSAHFETIKSNRAKYDLIDSQLLDDALERAEQREDDIADHLLDPIDEEFIPYAIEDPEFDPFNILDEPNDGTVKHTYPTPFQIPEGEYDTMIESLNLKQYEYLNHVLDCANRGETFFNIIGGGAGVGKSRLISAIYQSLLRHYNSIPGNNPGSIKVLISAPTGKAAFSIEGATLHSIFMFPINRNYEQLLPLAHDSANKVISQLCDLKLIIIDEFSMVGSKMLDNINHRLQQLFKSKDDFGGISILLFGDLRQLPPVGDKWIFEPMKSNPYYEICGTYLWDKFSFFELTEIMRQRNDKDFAMALNHMANGLMTAKDIQLIRSRQVTDEDPLPDNIIHLFRSNAEVDEFNDIKLAMLTTEFSISIAIDVIKGSCSERLKQQFLNYAKSLRKSESFGLMLNLRLQIGAKYMISSNIDTSDGIVNGATGTLMKLEYDDNHNAKRCWLEFFDSRSGKASRLKHTSYMKNNNVPDTWTPIEKCARALTVKKGSNIMVERSQFPLLISEGITIHKSQGATYQQVAVHLKKGTSRNAIYVACSRATTLEGLFMFGKFDPPKTPTEKDKAFCELKNLRENKYLNNTFNQQYSELENNKLTFIYQNVQSLNKHSALIKSNPLFINADIMIFVETWLKEEDVIEFENYECLIQLSNINNNEQRKPYGISCYVKNEISYKCTNIIQYRKPVANFTFQAVTFTYNYITIIALYIPPKLAIREALNCLQEIVTDNKPTIIIGDFNHDLSENKSNCLQQYLISKQFTSQLNTNQSTTNASTHIDWCFSNINQIKTHIYPTVYSHHKAIAFNLYEHNVSDFHILAERKQIKPSESINKLHIKLDDTNDDSDRMDQSYHSSNSGNNLIKPIESQVDDDPTNIEDDDDEQMDVDFFTTPVLNTTSKFGLQNNDGVSCYANAVVQCLFSIMEFRQYIAQHTQPPMTIEDKLKSILYKISNNTLNNCQQLRQFIGGEYVLREEQDSHLFLLDLLNKVRNNEFLQHIRFSYIPNMKRCPNCDSEVVGHEMPRSLSYTLYFPQNPPNTMYFETMFGPQSTNEPCDICEHNLTTKPTLTSVSQYLVICLVRIHMVDGNSIKVLTTFNGFNEDLLIIDSIVFQVKAVIIHISNDPNDTNKGGHYIAHVRYDNEWWEFNDSRVTKKPFDKSLKNVTVIILERIG